MNIAKLAGRKRVNMDEVDYIMSLKKQICDLQKKIEELESENIALECQIDRILTDE